MKIEMKTLISYEDCTRIIQGLNTLENIQDNANMLDDYDRFTINWLKQTFNICRESIKKHKKVEIRIIGN